jgi:cytochrome b
MSASMTKANACDAISPATVRVWDPLVRIFHWSLAGIFFFAFLTGDEWQGAHESAGYVIGGLLAFRLIWGLIGTKHARFTDFVYDPATVFAYMRDSLGHRAARYLGHNPAGGVMVIALLISIAVICTTGYMMTTDAFWGIKWVRELHETAAYSTLALIGLHLVGVLHASFGLRENLVVSMITGQKRASGND